MKRILLSLLTMLICSAAFSQIVYTPDYVHPENLKENYKELIFSDSLSSSFLLLIVNDIPLHKHQVHTEHIYVLEGSADMHIGDDNISLAPHDFLVIPKNTPHSLSITSREPFKVISIQSPKYEGKDKIFLD